MTTINWVESQTRFGEESALAEKRISPSVTAYLFAEPRDGGLDVTIAVRDAESWATTDSTQDWPAVEKWVPRAEWPEEIYAGKRTSTYRPHTEVDPLVRAILDRELLDLAEED